MRNHCTFGSRRQEYYRFGNRQAFKNLLDMRYSLVPYLYSEFVKSALRDELMYTPLGFLYPDDERAKETEDQMFVGGSIMIAPVYRQNTRGRNVYLPEDMRWSGCVPCPIIRRKFSRKGIIMWKWASAKLCSSSRREGDPARKARQKRRGVGRRASALIKYADGKTTYELYDDDDSRRMSAKKTSARLRSDAGLTP